MITLFNRYTFIKYEIDKIEKDNRKFFVFCYKAVLTAIDKIILCDLTIEISDDNAYRKQIHSEFCECEKLQQLYPIKEMTLSETELFSKTQNYVNELAEKFYDSFPFKEHFNYNRLRNVFGTECSDFEEYFFAYSLAAIRLNAVLELSLIPADNLNPEAIRKADSDNFAEYLNSFTYFLKKYETTCEQKFYKKILSYLSRDYRLSAQISLLSIIDKRNLDGSYTRIRGELNRIIDLGIFDNEYKIKLLIEIDDKTHEREDRKIRDNHIRQILEKLSIPIISFKPKDIDNPDYIIKQLGEFVKPELRKK